MGQFDTFVAVQVTDEGERDYEFPECLLMNVSALHVWNHLIAGIKVMKHYI